MRSHVSLLVLVLLACGPGSPGDPEGASSSGTGDRGDDGSGVPPATDAEPPTTEPPTTEPPTTDTTTTDAEPTTDTPTTDAEPPTTDQPVDPPLVFVLFGLVDDPSALAGIEQWQPSPLSCAQEPTPACSDPSQLGAPALLVDGVFAGPDAITIGSAVAVLFPYSGCDLACGSLVASAEGHDELSDGEGSLPPGLPCSTEFGGPWLAVDFGVLGDTGPRSVELQLTDACGALTDAQQITFAAH